MNTKTMIDRKRAEQARDLYRAISAQRVITRADEEDRTEAYVIWQTYCEQNGLAT